MEVLKLVREVQQLSGRFELKVPRLQMMPGPVDGPSCYQEELLMLTEKMDQFTAENKVLLEFETEFFEL